MSSKVTIPINRKLLIFGGSILAVTLITVLFVFYFSGKGNLDPANRTGPVKDGTVMDDGDVRSVWNGTWYGYLQVVDASGEYSERKGKIYDSYMVIDVNKKGNGKMAIYLEDEQTVKASIKAGSKGFAITEGAFWDMQLDPKNWQVEYDPSNVDAHVYISDTYIDPKLTDEDWFEYIGYFRPFGEKWDKEVSDEQTVPPGYNDYVEELEKRLTESPEPDDKPEPPVKYPTSDGGFTGAELNLIYDALPVYDDLTYKEVRDKYFNGIDGIMIYDEGTSAKYEWRATDDEKHYLAVKFEDRKGDGVKRLDGCIATLP